MVCWGVGGNASHRPAASPSLAKTQPQQGPAVNGGGRAGLRPMASAEEETLDTDPDPDSAHVSTATRRLALKQQMGTNLIELLQ